jgi:phosphoribosyl-ATP pyrophosphohydrolase
MTDILEKLAVVLEARKDQDPDTSYVSRLYRDGTDAILKKIGEEAAEVVISAKNPDKRAVVHEVADLWFHTLVLLASLDIKPAQVLAELQQRFGTSGLKEKQNRPKKRV